MYNFILIRNNKIKKKPITDENWNKINIDNIFIAFSSKTGIKEFRKGDVAYYFYGDMIEKDKIDDYLTSEIDKFDFEKSSEIGGTYYLFIYCKRTKKLRIASNVFGIFPIYYTENYSIITSNLEYAFPYLESTEINKRFILEQILFNYQFFNNSILKQVNLLPANTYIELKNNKTTHQKYLNIQDYFTAKPVKWKKALGPISELFIERAEKYFPDENSWISFTSGFDGRTIVSIAEYFKKKYKTFSFGAHFYDDITIPQKNAQELGINYHPIYLDEPSYIESEFFKNGIELTEISNGQLSYIYSHFLYSSKIISDYSKYLICGFHGSDLLRAPHGPGAGLSELILDLIYCKNEDIWIKKLKYSPVFNLLKTEIFHNELNDLIMDIKQYKKKHFFGLNKQQQLYVFIFNEKLRKIFGNLIKAQFENIIIRSPYLDFSFTKELLKTELAGVNNVFLSKNPLKRFKGQAVYAEIIRKTSPTIYKQKTSTGYNPKDLKTLSGKMKMIYPFFSKRIKRKLTDQGDILAIKNSIFHHFKNDESVLIDRMYFDEDKINSYLDKIMNIQKEPVRDALIMCLSLSHYIKSVLQKS